MIAFDTNLLVRLLVDDAPAQADVAEALLASHTVFIPKTVLMETEWVLRKSYRKTREQINQFFVELLDTENAVIEDHETVASALQWYRLGADFADALHLAACGKTTLYTFDQQFCKAARALGIAPEIRLLKA
ncbi:MAG: type II toxin-antitoxin system VapC family toxin [Candidatus Competibacteraceae bacterium]|nr:type II toxin-antitoxin system VapC family toxin [Candidatus Competibacteraceae bacterium]